MTTSLILACLWVIAASITALLPMRLQYAPGLALLASALPLLVWLGYENGPWLVLAAVLAILSMFRRPLLFFLRKTFGR